MLMERELSSPIAHQKHSTLQCPRYLSPGAHLSFLKTEHQKSKGTLYLSGYQVQLASRFTLHVFPMHLQSTSVQNKVSVSRQRTDRQFSSTAGCSRLVPGKVHIARLYHF